MEKKVYIVQCKDYDQVEDKLAALIDLMGGMGRFAKQGEKIVLKVNLLREARPEEAVSTHPSVVAAVGKLAKEAGEKMFAGLTGSLEGQGSGAGSMLYHM